MYGPLKIRFTDVIDPDSLRTFINTYYGRYLEGHITDVVIQRVTDVISQDVLRTFIKIRVTDLMDKYMLRIFINAYHGRYLDSV